LHLLIDVGLDVSLLIDVGMDVSLLIDVGMDVSLLIDVGLDVSLLLLPVPVVLYTCEVMFGSRSCVCVIRSLNALHSNRLSSVDVVKALED